MDDFSDFLCTVCGEPIGREPYFAAFVGNNARIDNEPLWPESVMHRRCVSDNVDARRRLDEPT